MDESEAARKVVRLRVSVSRLRALLSGLVAVEPIYGDAGAACVYCGATSGTAAPVPHARDCPWREAKVYLGEEVSSPDA